MLAKIQSCSIMGVDALPISVEIYMRDGQLPGVSTIGLPDAAVKESKDRVFAALMTSGYSFPVQRITINLAPANLRKEGSAFDLPIAIGLLKAMGVVRNSQLDSTLFLGELSLDGKVQPIRGILPIAANASKFGWDKLIVSHLNAQEAAVVDDINVFAVKTLKEVVDLINGDIDLIPYKPNMSNSRSESAFSSIDLSDVRGQEQAKRAMEIACAGGHNILMIGPPGSGKTMLARRISTILPELTLEEALEISKIHSISGILDSNCGIVKDRPFRSPHHSISDAGLIGGGSYPMPGEVSLAHNGVLFLDELPEFKRHVLEVMRQPLEDGNVTIARTQMTLTYPSRFILVAAMNPCPCGWRSHPERVCRCSPILVEKYLGRISGPLLDRIDLHIDIPAVNFHELTQTRNGETSATVRERVMKARKIQLKRFGSDPSEVISGSILKSTFHTYCNSQMTSRQIRKYCRIDDTSQNLLEMAMKRLGLSARAFDRILKVALTIADLDDSEKILTQHVAEAIQYRSLDRNHWINPC